MAERLVRFCSHATALIKSFPPSLPLKTKQKNKNPARHFTEKPERISALKTNNQKKKKNPMMPLRPLTEFPGQAEVDDLYERPGGVEADYVLRFQVEVDDVFAVKIQDALQDLPHVLHAVGLGVLEIIVHDTLEQLSTGNAGTQTRSFVTIE